MSKQVEVSPKNALEKILWNAVTEKNLDLSGNPDQRSLIEARSVLIAYRTCHYPKGISTPQQMVEASLKKLGHKVKPQIKQGSRKGKRPKDVPIF